MRVNQCCVVDSAQMDYWPVYRKLTKLEVSSDSDLLPVPAGSKLDNESRSRYYHAECAQKMSVITGF